MQPPIHHTQTGFTLIEIVVATTLVATAVAALAQLIAIGARQAVANRRALEAIVAAESKLEELRALSWTFSLENLSPSPPGALDSDVSGFFDRTGALTRRWAIAPLGADPNTRTISVCAYRLLASPIAEACVTTVRTRRP